MVEHMLHHLVFWQHFKGRQLGRAKTQTNSNLQTLGNASQNLMRTALRNVNKPNNSFLIFQLKKPNRLEFL